MFDLGATVCTAARRIARAARCAASAPGAGDGWAATTRGGPARGAPQSAFAGSDRQGRGRLLEALRRARVQAAGRWRRLRWPDDVARAERVAAALVDEGFARWSAAPDPVAPRCAEPFRTLGGGSP